MKKVKKVVKAKVIKTEYPFKQYDIEYRWTAKVPLYIDKKDKRYKKYVKQLKKDWFSSTETWCLTSVIASFILPRLIRYKAITAGYPMGLTEEKWNEMLDKMIFAFEWSLANDELENYKLSDKVKKDNWKRYDEGMKLFSDNFMQLWW